MQLQGQNLPALAAFDLMTRGNAAALGLDAEIGTLAPGAYADLVVLDARATPAMAHRMASVRDLEEELFVLMTLGDDRAVEQTYIAGRPALIPRRLRGRPFLDSRQMGVIVVARRVFAARHRVNRASPDHRKRRRGRAGPAARSR